MTLQKYINNSPLLRSLNLFDNWDWNMSNWDYTNYNIHTPWNKRDGKYSMNLDIPGYEKEEIQITTDDIYILIYAKNDLRGEYKYRINLPKNYAQINASLKNGVLTLELDIKDSKKESKVEIS